MRFCPTIGAATLAAALLAAGCGLRKPAGPTREAVTAALQQEAYSLKADGEKLDPVLRVKATWTVEGLDIVERPNDADRPWSGKIVTDEFARQFDYIYTASINRWVFQMPEGQR